MNSNRNLYKLLRVIFPEVLMEYFDISGWHDGSEKVIQDFPLRGKPVYLHVRRRRWYDKTTRETFSYTYDDLTAEGTKLTPEFVAFLKVPHPQGVNEM